MPRTTPSCGFAPYGIGADDARDEDTPARTIGSASSVARDGRSPRSSHATNPTMMTCRLPRTVARPAPTASMAWCQNIRSPVKKTPGDAPPAGSTRAGSGPYRRRSAERDEDEQRQPEDRPVDRPGRGRHRGVQVEDPRERDAHRAEQRRDARSLREPVERAGLRAQADGSPVRHAARDRRSTVAIVIRRPCPAAPRTASPSSSYWPGSGIDGASSIGSVPDCVFGKAMTSRMLVWCGEQRGPAIDAERDPAVRRGAVLEGVEDRAELLAHRLERVALEQERALEQLAPVDPDRAAAELPAVEREVVLERPRPAGRVLGRRVGGIAGGGHEQRLVLGQDAAERVVGGVPATVLGVPLVHREAVDPDVREHVRIGQAQPIAELDAQPAEDVGGDLGRVGDDQDQVALRRPAALDDRALRRRRTGTWRSARGSRRRARATGGPGPWRRTAAPARSARRSRAG